MNIDEVLSQMEANMRISELDYALMLSEKWKARAKICNASLKSCKMKKIEEINIVDEGDHDLIDLLSSEIDNIEEKITDLTDMLEDHEGIPLPLDAVKMIAHMEIFVYNEYMTDDVHETLIEEMDDHHRIHEEMDKLIEDIDRMWENNDTEEAIKEHIYNSFSNIYQDKPPQALRLMSQNFFGLVTHQRNVRVNLSDEQIKELTHEKYVIDSNDPNEPQDVVQCGTCLEDFCENEDVIVLNCDHKFHDKCIIPWLKKSVFCPTCRQDQRVDQSDGDSNDDEDEDNDENEGDDKDDIGMEKINI